MNVLTLPKKAAALEYKALRLPSALLQQQVVVRFLAQDSALRLGFERAVGTLDEKVGALFDDSELASRGHALRRRSEVLEKAVELEAKAEQRHLQAEATLQAGTARAEQTREQAFTAQRAGAEEALREEAVEKRRVEQDAKARLRAEKQRVVTRARAKTQAVTAQLREQEQRIDSVASARTAAPKAQLGAAVAEKKAADAERLKAERLASLADQERQSRRTRRQ